MENVASVLDFLLTKAIFQILTLLISLYCSYFQAKKQTFKKFLFINCPQKYHIYIIYI